MSALSFDSSLAAKIDHTLLKPDAGEYEVLRLCDEARNFGFASVCVNPSWVRLCADVLRDAHPRVCTVVGFPLGCNRTEVKLHEAEMALHDGAEELDMVLHIGRLKQGDAAYVEHDIAVVCALTKAASETNIVKVILETCLLTSDEIAKACRIALDGGAYFVKTSTGFSAGGATVEAVKLMRSVVGDRAGVKASGGIRSREFALDLLEAGASRLGASSSIALIRV